jgi:hypothetical protein
MVAPGIGLPSALSVIVPLKLPTTSSAYSLFLTIGAFENAVEYINSAKKQYNSLNFIIIFFESIMLPVLAKFNRGIIMKREGIVLLKGRGICL